MVDDAHTTTRYDADYAMGRASHAAFHAQAFSLISTHYACRILRWKRIISAPTCAKPPSWLDARESQAEADSRSRKKPSKPRGLRL